MKQITYRGGLVTFRIPSQWAEEYEPEGGGTFFDSQDESVTLRLNVLTLQSPRDLKITDSRAPFEGSAAFVGGDIQSLPDFQSICVLPPQRTDEAGEPLDFHTWAVARVIPPRSVRVAMFNTTVAIRRAEPTAVEAILTMLLHEVRNCKIHDGPAEPAPPRPWWKRWHK